MKDIATTLSARDMNEFEEFEILIFNNLRFVDDDTGRGAFCAAMPRNTHTHSLGMKKKINIRTHVLEYGHHSVTCGVVARACAFSVDGVCARATVLPVRGAQHTSAAAVAAAAAAVASSVDRPIDQWWSGSVAGQHPLVCS
jgi:hypothetical protein